MGVLKKGNEDSKKGEMNTIFSFFWTYYKKIDVTKKYNILCGNFT